MHARTAARPIAACILAAVPWSAPALAQPVLITSPLTVGSADTHILGVPLATAEITVRGTTLTLNGAHSMRSLTIEADSIVTHTLAGSGLHLSITGDCTLHAGPTAARSGAFDLAGKGFPSAFGPGAGISAPLAASGAGHAGPGGEAGPEAEPGGPDYGSVLTPSELGSGGGRAGARAGGAGGGCVRLTVGGTLTVDGRMSAVGLPGTAGGGSFAGGGSGGSVWISADRVAGTGTITVSGGSAVGIGGGGAGGRVALYANADDFAGVLSACGGQGFSAGAVGTIVRAAPGGPMDLTLANCGVDPASPTRLADLPVRDITLTDNALVQVWQASPLRHIRVSRGAQLVLSPGTTASGEVAMHGASGLVLDGPAVLADVSLTRDPVTGSGPSLDLRGNIRAGAVLMEAGVIYSSRRQGADGLSITSDTDITIDAPAFILLEGAGEVGGAGPGAVSHTAPYGAGAGHGGPGGNSTSGVGGPAFGVPERPESRGSGGGPGDHPISQGGPGGGFLRLTASGVLTLDGSINARGGAGWSVDGATGGGGGGSGGSVWLTAPVVLGGGSIDAGGGDGARLYGTGQVLCGAGAGGRVGIFALARAFSDEHISVAGGLGFGPAADGTIFFGSASINFGGSPGDRRLTSGAVAEFTADASGVGQLGYQWRWNGTPIDEGFDGGRFVGTRSATLTLTDVRCEHAGRFDCVVTDAHGGAASPPAVMTVAPAADINGDGTVDGQDVEAFFVRWENGESGSDLNGDGGIDGADVGFFFDRWERGC